MAIRRFSFLSALSALLLAALTAHCLGDASAQLAEALAHNKAGSYKQAEQLYKQIAADHAGTDYGIRAQDRLTCLYVSAGKEPEAQASFAELTGRYPQHKLLPAAITHVADAYRSSEKHARACELYHYVVDNWPDDEYALWSQMDIVISKAAVKDVNAANAAYDQLCTRYSGHELMPKAVCLLADNYRLTGEPAKAIGLYEHVLTNWPDAEHAFWSQMGLAMSNIRLNRHDAARAATDKLLASFSNDPNAPVAVCWIADKYRKSRDYDRACELYRHIVHNHPDAEHSFWAQMNLAVLSIQLGNEIDAEAAVDGLLAYSAKKDDRFPWAARTVADQYCTTEQYDNAFALYEYVVEHHGDAKDALWCQMNLAIANVRLGRDDAAQAATDRLLTAFSGDSDIPAAVCWVADRYRKAGHHDKARELYQYVLDKHPQAEHALWSKAGQATLNVRLGDDSAVLVDIETLVSKFSTHKNFSQAVQNIVTEYRSLREYEKADQVYQHVTNTLSNQRESDRKLWSQVATLVSNIALGNDANTEADIDSLTRDFNDHPDFTEAVFRIGGQYYAEASRCEKQGRDDQAKDKSRKAIGVWERIITDLPPSSFTPEAYYFSAVCCHRIGEHQMAIECYQKVVDEWPDHEQAWSAQAQVGHIYRYLGNTGAIPKSVADAETRTAFERVLQDYPGCGARRAARDWLKRHNKNLNGGEENE